MPLIFTYGSPKSFGISAKNLGHEPDILIEEAILEGYKTVAQDGNWVSVTPDPRSIVMGQIFNLSDENITKVDQFDPEFHRIPAKIGGHDVFVYVMKPEYLKAEEYGADDESMSEEEKDEFLKTALRRYSDICEYTDQLRQEFVDDIRFKAGQQWPEGQAQERQRDERPMQTINRIDNFINTVVNSGLQNPPSIKVRPVDSVTDPATADVISCLN